LTPRESSFVDQDLSLDERAYSDCPLYQTLGSEPLDLEFKETPVRCNRGYDVSNEFGDDYINLLKVNKTYTKTKYKQQTGG